MDKGKEKSNEKEISETKSEVCDDSKSEVADIEKAKADMISKLETQSETLTQSKDETLLSRPTALVKPYTESKSLTVRPAEEVWSHFKLWMQSNIESSDRNRTDDNNKGGVKSSSESDIPCLEDLTKPATKSECQDVEDSTKIATEFADHDSGDLTKPATKSECQDVVDSTTTAAETTHQGSGDLTKTATKSSNRVLNYFTKRAMAQDSRKVINEVLKTSVDNSSTFMKYTRNISRQRTVHDERIEYIRWWIIQQIKDREILLKFKIMEGKYSKDIETKLRCIEQAQDLQDDSDLLFDALDDYEKVENMPKRFKGLSCSIKKDSSKSAKKRKKDSKRSKVGIKSISSIFRYMYESSTNESKNENVHKWIHARNIMSDFNAYLVSKVKHDLKSELAERIAKSALQDLHLSLVTGSENMKCKIEHPVNGSLEDYINYINDLKLAVEENLGCLDLLLLQETSLILSLMTYLSQSREKTLHIFKFLDKERSNIFHEKIDKNKEFFEFCQRHFKKS